MSCAEVSVTDTPYGRLPAIGGGRDGRKSAKKAEWSHQRRYHRSTASPVGADQGDTGSRETGRPTCAGRRGTEEGWWPGDEPNRDRRPAAPHRRRHAAGMLRTWAAQTPDAPMLTEGSTTLTWGEVYDRARRVSHALAAGGVAPGDRVAFLDRNGIDYFEVLLRLRPARRGQRGRQLAPGAGRDRRHRRGRRGPHPLLRPRLRGRGQGDGRPGHRRAALGAPRPVRRVAGRRRRDVGARRSRVRSRARTTW